jgi:hypothetical protein
MVTWRWMVMNMYDAIDVDMVAATFAYHRVDAHCMRYVILRRFCTGLYVQTAGSLRDRPVRLMLALERICVSEGGVELIPVR